ncbi:MAG: ABC transporter substrate-binding protein [Alphaproteobacteria bacterium]|nr:ABC transporter substrate-binding protein [Alphaproteobacteria bacterium]
MKRRDVLALLGGAAAWRPLAAAAQQAQGTLRHIGVLLTKAAPVQLRMAAFEGGLRALGWTPDANLRIDYRIVEADRDQMRTAANEIVSLAPEAIVVQTTPMTRALRDATQTIPIVFVLVSDPIGDGIVASFAKPGGNITGFTDAEASLGSKWLQLLKEIAPSVTRAELLFNPDTAPRHGKLFLRPFEAAGHTLGVKTAPAEVHEVKDLETTLHTLAGPGGGLAVESDSFVDTHVGEIVSLAAQFALTAVYPTREYPEHGGLASYGSDNPDLFRRTASYVDKILKGAKPAELPVQQPTKYDLVVNMKTAHTLGLTMPQAVLARADEVIE